MICTSSFFHITSWGIKWRHSNGDRWGKETKGREEGKPKLIFISLVERGHLHLHCTVGLDICKVGFGWPCGKKHLHLYYSVYKDICKIGFHFPGRKRPGAFTSICLDIYKTGFCHPDRKRPPAFKLPSQTIFIWNAWMITICTRTTFILLNILKGKFLHISYIMDVVPYIFFYQKVVSLWLKTTLTKKEFEL